MIETSACACSLDSGSHTYSLSADQSQKVATVFKAMGHPSRLTLLSALQDGERCVCELAKLVPGNLSTVSRHLAELKHAGLLVDRKEGLNVYYRTALPCSHEFIGCLLARLSE